MTLAEAIKHLEKNDHYTGTFPETDYHKAYRLGIEALERIQATRSGLSYGTGIPLPSEDELGP